MNISYVQFGRLVVKYDSGFDRLAFGMSHLVENLFYKKTFQLFYRLQYEQKNGLATGSGTPGYHYFFKFLFQILKI